MSAHMDALRQRSGTVRSDDQLVSFLYHLLRDHVLPGDVEGIMVDLTPDNEVVFTNGWLAEYAKDIARRLTA